MMLHTPKNPRRLEIGQRLKTNYDTGPYTITGIIRGCTCVHIRDEIEDLNKPMPPHLHLWLKDKENKDAHLNWYDEETLKSVYPGDKDRIILLENPQPIQSSLAI